jgi:hypothetical protein
MIYLLFVLLAAWAVCGLVEFWLHERSWRSMVPWYRPPSPLDALRQGIGYMLWGPVILWAGYYERKVNKL